MKVNCVCAFCLNKKIDNAVLEVDFKNNKLYYYCEECKRLNEMDLSEKRNNKPFPKGKVV